MADIPIASLVGTRRIESSVSLSLLGGLGTIAAIAGATRVRMPIDSDYGLVAVLPAIFWAGLALLNICMGLAIRMRRPPVGALLLLQSLLVLVVYGVPGLITHTARTEVAWRHLSIVESLLETGTINSHIDAYFNWPGFFAALASYVGVTGMSPQTIALVAPVFNGLLWSAGVAVVVRALTANRQQMWLAVWLFTLTNWIDQDYLSPQAFAFFLYLAAVALLLRPLAAAPEIPLRAAVREHGIGRGLTTWWAGRRPVDPNPRRRVAALWLVMLFTAGIVASHQLSPFMLFAAIAILTVTGRSWAPGLLVIAAVILTIWLTTGAYDYLNGHPVLFQQSLGDTAGANVTERVVGTIGHQRVIQVRLALTLLMFVLSGLGTIRMFLRGQRDIRPVLLAVMPFAMVPVQSYGGEMVMRAALFALPFQVYLAAGLFLPRRQSSGLTAAPLVTVLALVLSVAIITGRYGNAAFDMFTPAEFEGGQKVLELAPPGAALIAEAHPTPWSLQGYVQYRRHTLIDLCEKPFKPAPCYAMVHDLAARTPGGAMLMMTRAASASVRMQQDPDGDLMERFERILVRRDEAHLVFLNADVRIYQFPPSKKEQAHG